MAQDIYVSLGVGAAIGLIIAILFGLNTKSSVTEFSHTVFGTSVSNFVEQFFLSFIALFFVVLTTVAIIVRDGEFPEKHPWKFTAETLAMGFIPAFLFLWSAYIRGAKHTLATLGAFSLLALKCGLGHVLLQYSGVYRAVFTR